MKNKRIVEIFTSKERLQNSKFYFTQTNKLKAKINILDLIHKTPNKGMRNSPAAQNREQDPPQFQYKTKQERASSSSKTNKKTQKLNHIYISLPIIKMGITWQKKKKAAIIFSINTMA